jgi:hypothetical protein
MECKVKDCKGGATKVGYCSKHFATKRLYKHGLPFSKGLDKTLDGLKLRIKRKKASMLIIDGGVGEGKTTLSVEVAEYYQGSNIDLKKQYAIGGEQFQEKLVMCFDSKLPVIIYDEAGDFNTRGALTGFNQMLNRVFDTYRAFQILVIMVLPSFHILDNPLFDKQIPRGLIHCHGRGYKSGNYSGYSLYRMYYIRDKLKKYTVPSYAYTGTSPNYRGHFLDLSPSRSIELEKVSIAGKMDIVNDNILRNRGLMSYRDIAKKIGMSIIWVKRKVSKLKIKETKIYKRNKYFEQSIIYKLEEQKA